MDFIICDFVFDMRVLMLLVVVEIVILLLDDINYKFGNIKSRMSKFFIN